MNQYTDAFRKGESARREERRRGETFELKAIISRYRAERHRLREALKPFGAAADAWAGYADTEPLVEGFPDAPDGACDLTVGHLRAAAAALTPTEDKSDA